MKCIIIYTSKHPGGGPIFLNQLKECLSKAGIRVKDIHCCHNYAAQVKDLINEALSSDIIIWYGYASLKHEIKLMKILLPLLRRSKKPLIRMIGGALLVRKPDRPLYVLNNIYSILKLVLKTFPKVRLFFAVHNRDDYKLLLKLGIKTLYFPPGVNTEIFKYESKGYKNFSIICNASPASFVKGTDILLRIIPKVIARVKEFQMTILTGGMGFTYFRNALKAWERRFPEKIRVIDRWLSPLEVASLLSKGHLFIFPSRFEGFGIIVLEAQSCGLPVIAFDIPGAPRDVIIDGLTGKRIKPYNINEFVKYIIKYYEMYYSTPERYQFIRFACRKRAILFDINRVCTLWINQLQSTLMETLN